MELTERGDGPGFLLSVQPDLAAIGYTETEWTVAGTVRSLDGQDTAAIRTRLLLRRPVVPGSGTVLVEWLNVTSGGDASPHWTYTEAEIVRQGHVWVGVSVQFAGVQESPAGSTMGMAAALRTVDAQRYGDLVHPGDAYCLDLFHQLAPALRALLTPTLLLAVGQSQSAAGLTAYLNNLGALADLTSLRSGNDAYDGYLLHSRPGRQLPVLGTSGASDLLRGMRSGAVDLLVEPDVPVLVVQTEGDLFAPLHWLGARQPDSARLRTWELAGCAHADRFMLGGAEEMLGLPYRVNRGQQAFVVRAAQRQLVRWSAGGDAPPPAAPLQLTDDGQDVRRDRHGNALGGVRTPAVDAPVYALSGRPGQPESGRPSGERDLTLASLVGSSVPLTGVWADSGEYLTAYQQATDAAIAAGVVLAEDRAELLADASPELAC